MRDLTICFLLLLAACGEDGVTDLGVADAGADQSVFYGAHVPLPTIPNQGGPIIAAPEVTTFVWQGDEATGAAADAFISWMLTSSYFTDSVAEYGVGAGSSKGVVVLPTALPTSIDYLALNSFVAGILNARPMNASSLPLFIIPSTTTITIAGVSYCTGYGESYHYETFGVTSLPYIVILDCGADPITQRLSHEIAEAAMDPLGSSNPAWANLDLDPYTESADLCYSLNTTYTPTESIGDAGATPQSYLVTRIYSTKAAADGTHDPCVPAPAGKPYFNVALDPFALKIPASGSATFKLQPFAFADVGSVHWSIRSVSGFTFTPSSGDTALGTEVEVTVQATTGASGDHATFISTSDAAGDHNVALLAFSMQ